MDLAYGENEILVGNYKRVKIVDNFLLKLEGWGIIYRQS
jgi:hypothetical protein